MLNVRKMNCSVNPLEQSSILPCYLTDTVRYTAFSVNAEVAPYPFHLSCDKTKPSLKGQPAIDIFAIKQSCAFLRVLFLLAHILILGMTHFTIDDTDDPISILRMSKSE